MSVSVSKVYDKYVFRGPKDLIDSILSTIPKSIRSTVVLSYKIVSEDEVILETSQFLFELIKNQNVPPKSVSYEHLADDLLLDLYLNGVINTDIVTWQDLCGIIASDPNIICNAFTNPTIVVVTNNLLKLNLTGEVVNGSVFRMWDLITYRMNASSYSWMFWDIPPSKKVFIRAKGNPSDTNVLVHWDVCNASGRTLVNPPDYYYVSVAPFRTAGDFLIVKGVSGVGSIVAEESIDLQPGVFYDVEVLYEFDGQGNNRIRAWRDGVLIFDVVDVEPALDLARSVRIRVYNRSTTGGLYAYIKPILVVVYEQ